MGTCPPFDPTAGARRAPAVWDPDIVSSVVTLAPAPPGFGRGATWPAALRPLVELSARAARHLVFDLGGARHRVRILDDSCDGPLALVMPPDGAGLAEAGSLARALAGELVDRPRSPASRFQRYQFATMLDMFDAAASGASLRDIAVATLFPWLDLDATEWKTSTERRRVQRLLASARHMVAGGYRALIEH